jgi:hypothetical protein
MKAKERKALEKLDSTIGEAMTDFVASLKPVEDDGDFGVTTMDRLVSVLSINHQAAIYALVAATLETCESVPDSVLRSYIDECVDDFSKDLRANISKHLKNDHKRDILDPNADLRETLLEIARHEKI